MSKGTFFSYFDNERSLVITNGVYYQGTTCKMNKRRAYINYDFLALLLKDLRGDANLAAAPACLRAGDGEEP